MFCYHLAVRDPRSFIVIAATRGPRYRLTRTTL